MTLQRKPMKRRTLKRDWVSEAIPKIERESACRVCGESPVEAAHTIGRRLQDVEVEGPRGGVVLLVKAEAVIPLCRAHHQAFDARRLDLLPYLFLPEQVFAVESAGGIASANKRLSGRLA